MKSQTSPNCPVNHCNQQKWQKINKKGNNRSRRNRTQPFLVVTVTPNSPQQQCDTTYNQAYNNIVNLFIKKWRSGCKISKAFQISFLSAIHILENCSDDHALEETHHTQTHILIEDIHYHHCQCLLWRLSSLVFSCSVYIQGVQRTDRFCAVNKLTKQFTKTAWLYFLETV